MSRFKSVQVRMADLPETITDCVWDVDLGDIGVGDTFTLTPTRVDRAAAGAATAAIAYNADTPTQAANIQAAVRALGGIYADAVCVEDTPPNYELTVYGGYDVTWALDDTGFTQGPVAVKTAGKATYTGVMPIGRFAAVNRIRLVGFTDNSLDVSIVDHSYEGLIVAGESVFVKTAIDTWTSPNDVPYDHWLTCDGALATDGTALARQEAGVFVGPLDLVVDTSAPIATYSLEPYVEIYIDTCKGGAIRQRSSGAITADGTQDWKLGSEFAKIRRIKIESSVDDAVTVSIADAHGKVVYATAGDADYDPALITQIGGAGIDQGATGTNGASVVVRGPLTATVTNMAAGSTLEVIVWAEV